MPSYNTTWRHRTILQASQNEVLLRVWDSLAVDLRIRGVVGKVSRDLPEVVESHQPIVDAFEHGRGREAGVLLRNHVETTGTPWNAPDLTPALRLEIKRKCLPRN